MKILIATDTYDPSVNGVVSSTKTLVRELMARGHELRVLAPASRSRVEGHVYYLRSVSADQVYPDVRLTLPHFLPVGIIAELEAWKPDIIHCQTEFAMYGIAKKIAWVCRAPMVNTVHTYYEDYTQYFSPSEELGRAALKHFMHFILHDSAAVIVPTMKIAATLERYGLTRPVFCIPTGIDLKKFTDPVHTEHAVRLRKQLGIRADECVFVSLGRIGKEKNPELLVRAFSLARQQGIRARMVFVGDGPALGSLKTLVHELDLDEACIFTGRVNPDEVGAYYRLGSIFVSASNSETQGLTYLEALSSGLALLVKSDPCLQGVLREHNNGLSFETMQECSELMLKLSRDKALVERLSCAALISSQEHSAHNFGASIETLYQMVLDRKELYGKELFDGRLTVLEEDAKAQLEHVRLLLPRLHEFFTHRFNHHKD